MTKIPKTRSEAIEALVEQDVALWGEAEREASRRMHVTQRTTYGLALNGLASRAELDGAACADELRRAADAALTDEDQALLRSGG